jgi:hypothetical protein
MAYDGWIEFNGVEIVNLSRVVQLSETLGIDTVWPDQASVDWIQTALSGVDYGLVTATPWYDSENPASEEFAGLVPLSFVGLGDSSVTSSTVEYVTNGGKSGKARDATLPIVASVAIVASTPRGADFGYRWLDRTLRDGGADDFCAGARMEYFSYKGGEAATPLRLHYRDVSLTRGVSVTSKRDTYCSATWLATFTLSANDPFEYGTPSLGADDVGGGSSIPVFVMDCAGVDTTPLYDPLNSPFVDPPTAPNFYPEGWELLPGTEMDRFVEPLANPNASALNVVPLVRLNAQSPARFVRVCVWSESQPDDAACGPLWSCVVSYLPASGSTEHFVIDGEQQAAYMETPTGFRRAESLIFASHRAEPINWTSFNDDEGLFVTLDIISGSDAEGYDGAGTVRASVELIYKSD